jgi:hypothetical protein
MKTAVLALAVSGCSFVFVEGPPSNYQHQTDVHCTSNEVFPMLDVVFAGINALDVSMVGSHQYHIDDSTTESLFMGVSAGLIAVHIASAIYGFVKTSSCQDAMANLSARSPHRFENFLPPQQTPTTPAPPPVPPPTEAVPATQEQPPAPAPPEPATEPTPP